MFYSVSAGVDFANINPKSLQALDCNCKTVTFQKTRKKFYKKTLQKTRKKFYKKTLQKTRKKFYKKTFQMTKKKSVKKPRKCDPVKRVLNARRVNLGMRNVMLVIGSLALTVVDLWTLLLPHVAMQHFSETSSIQGFVGGWLVYKVACS